MGGRLRLGVVATLILTMGATLLWAACRMAPIRDGTSAGFWYAACRIRLENTNLFLGDIYGPKDGWLFYDRPHWHGSDLFRIRVEEALADLPHVARLLEEEPPHSLRPEVEDGYRAWHRIDPSGSDGLALIEQLRAAQLRHIEREHPDLSSYLLAKETRFQERWQRATRYSANVIGEFLFLTSLILLGAWPWLCRGGPARWAIHLGLLPLLFFLPFWLGYAPLTFTSAGPIGGCLYPWLLVQFRSLPWIRLDTMIVSKLPRLLEPFSQTPGEMMSLSDGPGVGPVAVCALAIMLGSLPFFISRLRKNDLLIQEIEGRPEQGTMR